MIGLIAAIRCPIKEDAPYDCLKLAAGSGVALFGIICLVIKIVG